MSKPEENRPKLIPESADRVIEQMSLDLEKYNDSPNAYPDVVRRREEHINTLVDAFQKMEQEHERIVGALRHDLDHSRELANGLRGQPVDMNWSWMDGTAQSILEKWRRGIDFAEGRTMSKESADRRRAQLGALSDECDVLYRENIQLQLSLARMNLMIEMFGDWCYLNGIDPRTVVVCDGDARAREVFKKARIQFMQKLLDSGKHDQLFSPNPDRSRLANYLILKNSVTPEVASKRDGQIMRTAEHSVP